MEHRPGVWRHPDVAVRNGGFQYRQPYRRVPSRSGLGDGREESRQVLREKSDKCEAVGAGREPDARVIG